MTRVLCLCEGGNVRSVGAAFVLKQELGHDALAASIRFNSRETLDMLFAWADKVIAMYRQCFRDVPKEHRGKLVLLDVGDDRFGSAFHPDLLAIVRPALKRWLELGMPCGGEIKA